MIDQAFARFNSIRGELEAAIADLHSEQDARLQLINRIIIEVLGWPYPLIRTEPATGSGYIDYVLLDANKRNLCVIEAKKVGALELDTITSRLTTVGVGGQVLKPAMDGIKQAIRYSAEVGTVYAVLTDGARWVFFRAIRSDGLPPKEGKAFVFPSLTSILEDFATFYELRAGLKNLDRTISGVSA
jgi:predicted type IV restriction endonuclease